MKGIKNMKVKEALSILQPKVNSESALKDAFREAAMKYHPDHGGDAELMKLVNAAYDLLKKCTWTPYEARAAGRETPLTETIQAVWDQVKHFPGINGEVIGSWLWISGDTKQYKEQLKNAGFKWSKNKVAWYFHTGGYRKRSKHDWSMDHLRNIWGTSDLEPETADSIAA